MNKNVKLLLFVRLLSDTMYNFSGNILMIGPIGAHLGTLARLALHISDIPVHAVDTSKHNTFLDGLRSAVRLTGAEGKVLTLFFTVSVLICAE